LKIIDVYLSTASIKKKSEQAQILISGFVVIHIENKYFFRIKPVRNMTELNTITIPIEANFRHFIQSYILNLSG
jgi:hypothetical protein